MKALIVFRVTSHLYLGMLSPMNPVFVSFSSVFIYCSFLKLFVLKDLDGKWGMRIESALSVRKVKVSFWGDLLFREFA